MLETITHYKDKVDNMWWVAPTTLYTDTSIKLSTFTKAYIKTEWDSEVVAIKTKRGDRYDFNLDEWTSTQSSREEEEKGIKHDTDTGKKPILSLIPKSLLWEVGRVLSFGASKYAAHNWRKGINQSRLISAALRHITAFNEGEELDPESGLSHLAHAICCLSFALEQQLKPETYKEFDDRYHATKIPKEEI